MKALLALLACLAGGALLMSAPAPLPKPDRSKAAIQREWQRLHGTWEVVSIITDGTKMPLAEGEQTLTLKDGKYTVRVPGEEVGLGVAKIDPTTSPRSIDSTPGSGPNKGKTVRCIYEVKGDTLRICLPDAGKPRPKAFESTESNGHTIYTFKRVKP